MKPEWIQTWFDGSKQHWELKTRSFSIVILNCHRDYNPGVWIMHVYGLGIANLVLGSISFEKAKKEAVKIVKRRVAKIVSDTAKI